MPPVRLAAVAALLALFAAAAPAQEAAVSPPEPGTAPLRAPPTPPAPRAEPGRGEPARPAPPPPAPEAGLRRLPADVVTRHTLDLPGRTLRFTATAGRIVLDDPQGKPLAEVAFVSYALDGPEPRTRPVAFALNGGPGSASAWLHLGTLGPWRLPLEGEALAPSAPPELVPNGETWLDFTDLVFIDPVGTGYSRVIAPGDDVRRRYWAVEGDIESIAEVIRRWLEKEGRLASPKVIVGESYAGFRAPKLARALQSGQGVGVAGLVLVSPVLDFNGRVGIRHNPMAWVARLPSLAAAARAAKGPVAREDLRDVEGYATGEFLADLLRGERDAAALDRLSTRVAELTGLDPALVRRLGGRIDTGTFVREFDRRAGRVASAYDASVTGLDPSPTSPVSRPADPFTGALAAPMTAAIVELTTQRLGWRPDGRYLLSNGGANREWDWGRGRSQPEAVGDLRDALALDPRLRVLVAHGLTDLVTPYFDTKLILDQIPALGAADRMRFAVYPGGHMFYSRDDSRLAFREAARELIAGAGERRAGP